MDQLFLQAYIDPVSGSIVLQGLIAGAISVAAVFRESIVGGVSRLIHGRKAEPVSDESVVIPAGIVEGTAQQASENSAQLTS